MIGVGIVARIEHEVADHGPGRRDVVLRKRLQQGRPAAAAGLEPFGLRGRQVVKPPVEFRIEGDHYAARSDHPQ